MIPTFVLFLLNLCLVPVIADHSFRFDNAQELRRSAPEFHARIALAKRQRGGRPPWGDGPPPWMSEAPAGRPIETQDTPNTLPTTGPNEESTTTQKTPIASPSPSRTSSGVSVPEQNTQPDLASSVTSTPQAGATPSPSSLPSLSSGTAVPASLPPTNDVASIPSATSTNDIPNTGLDQSSRDESTSATSRTRTGPILGIVFGSLIFVAIVVCIVLWLFSRRRKQRAVGWVDPLRYSWKQPPEQHAEVEKHSGYPWTTAGVILVTPPPHPPPTYLPSSTTSTIDDGFDSPTSIQKPTPNLHIYTDGLNAISDSSTATPSSTLVRTGVSNASTLFLSASVEPVLKKTMVTEFAKLQSLPPMPPPPRSVPPPIPTPRSMSRALPVPGKTAMAQEDWRNTVLHTPPPSYQV